MKLLGLVFALLTLSALSGCSTYQTPEPRTPPVGAKVPGPAVGPSPSPSVDPVPIVIEGDKPPVTPTSVPPGPANPTGPASNPPPPPPPPPANLSQGTGGKLGLTEAPFTDSKGLRSSYKINAPQDSGASKAYGIHIHLHGDGGGGYRDYPNRETRQDLIGVTVKAPNQGLTWGRNQGVAHANYLNELIQNEIVKRYNVNLDRIFFSGVSGGAYFLAGHFLPMFGRVYKSGAFLMCGGMPPSVAFEEPQFLKSFRIHWQVTAGERGDITQSVNGSISRYKTALQQAGGDATMQTSEVEGEGGHCEFDGRSYTTGIQYMMDLKFKTVVTR